MDEAAFQGADLFNFVSDPDEIEEAGVSSAIMSGFLLVMRLR